MTEKLLQFIWKHRYFNQRELTLEGGEALYIEYSGEENFHQGPDFVNARLRIDNNQWVGSVEMHLLSSGWLRHSHDTDNNYRNVILHVVWKQDTAFINRNIPTLVLDQRISHIMLDTYMNWMHNPAFVPCESSFKKTEAKNWETWASRLLIMRLNRKMKRIHDSLKLNRFHWEEQLWWMVATYFGNPVNSQAFETIAKTIPFALIARHRLNNIQFEALLFGQANLLEREFDDPYPVALKTEYTFLRKKYRLKKIYEPVHHLRMRPENFPEIRLSQLGALYSETVSFFSWLLECESLFELRKRIMVKSNSYWNNHYVFEKYGPYRAKIVGSEMCNMIIINSIIPLLYTYGSLTPDSFILKKSLEWLKQMPAEQNKLIGGWKKAGVTVKRAAASQALTELKNEYCNNRKCLECDIGRQLLQAGT